MPTPESSSYIEVMQKMLDDNAKAAAAVVAGAQKVRDEVAAERAAARKALHETTQNAATLSAKYYQQHWNRIEKDLRKQINRDLAAKLLDHSEPPDEVAALLGMPEAEVLELVQRFGYMEMDVQDYGIPGPDIKWQKMNTSYARVSYEDQGRGGNVVFQLGNTICRFWYEFGGGATLVFIDVPAEAHWEAHTKIPLAQRDQILNFIGQRAIADKAPGYRYRIEATSIVIY
ncbi:MAG: hypothetical protein ACKV1O_26810 [Saprospiraceae bacterium]